LVPAATVVVEFVAPSITVTVPALTQSPWLATYLVGQQLDRHGKRFVPGATDAVELVAPSITVTLPPLRFGT